MQGGEGLQSLRTGPGEAEADDPMVFGIAASHHETGRVSAVDELDRAVVSKQQVVRNFTDSRTALVVVTADRQQQLMLSRGEARRARLLLAPTLETAQPGSQPQEAPVVLI